VACSQKLEKDEPVLGGGGAKPGEVIVADLGADAVAALMACSGVGGKE
jgi:hypothetical protein